MKNILLVMSLSGSVMLFFYGLAASVFKRWFSVRRRYHLLMISMIFYLFPFPYFKSLYLRLLTYVFQVPPGLFYQAPAGRVFPANVVYIFDHTVYLQNQSRKLLLALCIIGTISFTLILIQIHNYNRVKNTYMSRGADAAPDPRIVQAMRMAAQELSIKKPVSLYISDQLDSPCVIGIFTPTLLFPAKCGDLAPDQLRDIFLHELSHIKHHDLAVKFLALLIAAIHWFNPLCHLLFREICCLCELYSDSVVTEKRSYDERMKYGKLIIDIAANSREDHTVSAGLAGGGKKVIKRRISEMKITNKKSRTYASILIAMIMTITCSFTIFAYQPPVEVAAVQTNEKLAAEEGWIELQGTQSSMMKLPYDCFVTDKDGNVTEFTGAEASGRQACIHSYYPGTKTIHRNGTNGGCKISVYDVNICEFCGRVTTIGLNYTAEYTTCPH